MSSLLFSSPEGNLGVAAERCRDSTSNVNRNQVQRICRRRGSNVVNANIKYDDWCTALRRAGAHGKLGVVQYLVQMAVADICAVSTIGETPLHFASARGKLEVVKYLVEMANADIAAVDAQGSTPLHIACEHGKLEVDKYLVAIAQDRHLAYFGCADTRRVSPRQTLYSGHGVKYNFFTIRRHKPRRSNFRR
jgi:ankyrin repeat protein